MQAVVGPDGGTLSLAGGARLRIPPGTLLEPTEVLFAEGRATNAFSGEDQRTIGTPLQVEPALVAPPDAAIEVTVPFVTVPSGFSEEDLAAAFEVPEGEQRALQMGAMRTRWQYVTATVDGNDLTARFSELGGLRIQFLAAR